jgi:hypothetical protein
MKSTTAFFGEAAKNLVWTEKTCKPLEQEENQKNHAKSPRWLWARKQMGNPG